MNIDLEVYRENLLRVSYETFWNDFISTVITFDEVFHCIN